MGTKQNAVFELIPTPKKAATYPITRMQHAAARKLSAIQRAAVILIASLLLICSSCNTPEAMPTPTATRTPIIPTATPTLTPTATPTLTPTSTPTPTPTLPAGLILSPTPSVLTGIPPLPADLIFIRDGNLYVWPAQGGSIEVLPQSDDTMPGDIVDYQVSAGGHQIVYITGDQRMFSYDRQAQVTTLLPTSGRLLQEDIAAFELLANGKSVVYAAWGVYPSAEQSPLQVHDSFASILMLDIESPRNVQRYLGYCTTIENRPCQGFILAPNQSFLLIHDGRGLYETSLDILVTTHIASMPELSQLVSISPDREWLLIEHTDVSPARYSLLKLSEPGKTFPLDFSCSASDCENSTHWINNELWIATWSKDGGCLLGWNVKNLISTGTADSVICQSDGWSISPSDLVGMGTGSIGFLNRGCGPKCAGPGAGVYTFSPPDVMAPIALLPESNGTLLWAPDGLAFLYISSASDTRYIGITDGSGYWDVSRALNEAHAFTWSSFASIDE